MMEQAVSEVRVGRLLKKYWRVRVPRKFREGVTEALIELEGERWLVELDKHGRIYIPVKLRPSIEKAKTIIIKREGSTIILKPRPY